MELGLTTAFVVLATFIFSGITAVIYRPINNEKGKLMSELEERTDKLVEGSKEAIKKNKRDFVHDLNSLYRFGVRLERLDRDLIRLILGFCVMSILVFLFELVSTYETVFGTAEPSLESLFFTLGFELSFIFTVVSFAALYTTFSCRDVFYSKKHPREMIRKRFFKV